MLGDSYEDETLAPRHYGGWEWTGFHSLITIGYLAELANSHGFLLYVVLSEEARLPGHQLLDGGRNDQIINIIIGCSWLPLLWRNDL